MREFFPLNRPFRNFLAYGLIILGMTGCEEPPRFESQGYYFVGTPDEATARSENPRLLEAVSKLVEAVIAQNREAILDFIHPQEGAIIDAKAFVSKAEVRAALYDPESVLYRVLWDDKYWKETAPAENIRSYRKIFSNAGVIKTGLFWYSPTECEVRLDFKNRPAMGIMGNLIFRKRGTSWYLMNFF